MDLAIRGFGPAEEQHRRGAAMHGSSIENLLFHAWLALLAFAAIGYLIGRLAQWTVEESLRASLTAEPPSGLAESKPLAAPVQA